MRRKEKEIIDIKKINGIIDKAEVFRLAMSLNDTPYIVPLNFGYKDGTIYFHCAKKGKKIDILKQNNKVCFEFDTDCELVESEKGCNWSMKFKSVIGSGKVSFLEDTREKQKALEIILQHYSVNTFQFEKKQLDNTLIAKIDIDQITGKQSGY